MNQSKVPAVFVGSSSEGKEVAQHFQAALEQAVKCEVTLWDQSVFTPGGYTMEALIDVAQRSDFAVLVATADDVGTSRGATSSMPRDNVLLELGLFMGVLGVHRAFILKPGEPVRLPSDLAGITYLSPYARRGDGNIAASLTGAVLDARRAINRHGVRTPQGRGSERVSPERVDHQQELEREVALVRANAADQGWRCQRTESALKLMSPSPGRRKMTFEIPRDALDARRELRVFADRLRAGGMRVNRRVRDPVS